MNELKSSASKWIKVTLLGETRGVPTLSEEFPEDPSVEECSECDERFLN